MKKIYDEKVVANQAIKGMEKGDVAVFPISRMTAVRVSCTNIGLVENRKFTTKSSREDRTLTVTRVQ